MKLNTNIIQEKSVNIYGHEVILQKNELGHILISSNTLLMKTWVLVYAYHAEMNYSYSDVYSIEDDETLICITETSAIYIDEDDETLENVVKDIVDFILQNCEH